MFAFFIVLELKGPSGDEAEAGMQRFSSKLLECFWRQKQAKTKLSGVLVIVYMFPFCCFFSLFLPAKHNTRLKTSKTWHFRSLQTACSAPTLRESKIASCRNCKATAPREGGERRLNEGRFGIRRSWFCFLEIFGRFLEI